MTRNTLILTLAVLTLCLLSSGCKEIRFSHKTHLQQEIECDTCHSFKPGTVLRTMPDISTCTTCHEDIDKEAALKAIGYGLKKAEQAEEWAQDVGFSGKNHEEYKIKCIVCHEGIDKAEMPGSSHAIRTEVCLDCHGDDKAKIIPKSHRVGWKRSHGKLIKEGFDVRGEARCYLCHKKDSCVDCHQSEKPVSHTNQWRQRGHGIASEIDRDRCAVCHQMDYCIRCHEQTAPRNHTAGWSGSTQRHCSVCHWPLNSVGCYVCHKGTPGHDTAPDRPAGHVSGSDCRACHIPGARLPHPDDGESCERCHR